MARSCVTVQEGYERWAPIYDRLPNPLLALEERQLKSMLPPIEGKRVLDLACGTGRWLAWLMSSGARSGVGSDFSPAMLAGAREKSTICKRLVQADCRFLAFDDAAFDIVICSFAVGHIREVQHAARELARVAAPGADIYISELHPQAHEAGWRTGFRDRRGAVEISSWSRSVDEFLALWISTGFECARVVECRFGEAERQVFADAGKGQVFEEFRKIPAVLICHFRKSARR